MNALTSAFFSGLLLALGLILPLGPQNMFVINQGINHRRWRAAVPAALAAAVCDTLLIILAVTGVSVAVLAVRWLNSVLTAIGVVFLSYMGWLTWRAAADGAGGAAAGGEAWPVRRQVAFAASVSLLNPHAILDTVAVIGPASLAYPSGAVRLAFTLACILTSWLWFLGLATGGHLVRSSRRVESLQLLLNRASAVVMWYTAMFLFKRLLGF